MEVFEKSHHENAHSSSSLSRLPDEILLQILSKLIDLKTLCSCYLVSKRFSSIVLHVDSVSFTAPLVNSSISGKNHPGDVDGGRLPKKPFWSFVNNVVFKPFNFFRRIVVASSRPLPPIISSFYGDSFRSAISFLCKFKGVRSLCVELPSSSHGGIDDGCLFKWKVKFGNRIESFSFLSPSSVCDANGTGSCEEEEDMELSNDLFKQGVHIAFQCLKDVILRHRMLLYFIKDLPMLEQILITDSCKRGRLSLRDGKLREVRGMIDTRKPQLDRIEVPVRVSGCHIPVLEVPISGYVMKGASLVVMEMNDEENGDDGLMVSEDEFEDREEAAYGEAIVEIKVKHKSRMKRLL